MRERSGVSVHVAIRSRWKKVDVAMTADGVATRESDRHRRAVGHSGISGDYHWNQSKIHARGFVI